MSMYTHRCIYECEYIYNSYIYHIYFTYFLILFTMINPVAISIPNNALGIPFLNKSNKGFLVK